VNAFHADDERKNRQKLRNPSFFYKKSLRNCVLFNRQLSNLAGLILHKRYSEKLFLKQTQLNRLLFKKHPLPNRLSFRRKFLFCKKQCTLLPGAALPIAIYKKTLFHSRSFFYTPAVAENTKVSSRSRCFRKKVLLKTHIFLVGSRNRHRRAA
jgi:hypothetical protein